MGSHHQWLYNLFSLRLIISLQPLCRIISRSLMAFADAVLSVYFRCCNLSRFVVQLDDNETKLYIWAAAKHHKCNKPNLVLIHGFGPNSKWQFIFQVRQLTHDFNVYIPDLVFFGESYSSKLDRSVWFQAKCVCDGLKKMKVGKCSVYAISYGGFVGYQMAAKEMNHDDEEMLVEKLVIVSSGIVCKHDSKLEHVKKIGRSVVDLLVAKTPEDVRMLCRMSISKCDFSKWIPDFFLWGFIDFERCKREKEELMHELLMANPDIDLLVLKQETLLVWGEKDSVFPVDWAYQLHRHLGEKSKLEIIKGVGHALNLEAPYSLNRYISSFVLGSTEK